MALIVGSFRRLIEDVVASAPSTGGTQVMLVKYFDSDDFAYDRVQFSNDPGGGQSRRCGPGQLLIVEALEKRQGRLHFLFCNANTHGCLTPLEKK